MRFYVGRRHNLKLRHLNFVLLSAEWTKLKAVGQKRIGVNSLILVTTEKVYNTYDYY